MKKGNYKKASSYFKNIAHKYPEHAFAHYFLALAYEQLNQEQTLVEKHRIEFSRLVEQNGKWRSYAQFFKISLL